ncbi:PAS domain S-box-containing protein [Bacillus mesophilus]|uniref:histidine kinase n=2 Tax=Bacillus mesophilus TaxID=1808955 RepID=A0A6M0QAD5_9BACI|nr:PAS domain S-box-containing protein [Bacillus mesophilus]NEY73265.1 PAS domain-containing protein [Bacillus mesophilus]
MDITKELDIKSFLGVPIFHANGKLFGNLCCFDSETYSFSEEDAKLLQTMAAFLTYVIDLEQDHSQAMIDFEKLFHQSELVLSSLSEGVFGLNVEGEITFCNPSTLSILDYEEGEKLVGRSASQEFLIEDEKVAAVFGETVKDGVTRTRKDGYFKKKNQQLIPVEYTTKAIYDSANIVGTVVTFKDITEQKQSEEIILKSEKLSLAGQLAAGIAHEIRNPLTAIKGFLQMIDAGYQKDAYIKIMSSELERIELIVSELLLLAKPQDVMHAPFEIASILDEVISILNTQALLTNVEIAFTKRTEGLFIKGDSNQIKQVFINLIKNAIEALASGGQIEIDLLEEGSNVVIYVKDNGEGIPEDKIAELGQPFYSTKEEGTGLGLMVSFNIIQNHHGSINVKSAPTKGTTFEIKIPMYKAKALAN